MRAVFLAVPALDWFSPMQYRLNVAAGFGKQARGLHQLSLADAADGGYRVRRAVAHQAP